VPTLQQPWVAAGEAGITAFISSAARGKEFGMAQTFNGGPREAFTFDDVLLKPALSDVLPSEVDVGTESPAASP